MSPARAAGASATIAVLVGVGLLLAAVTWAATIGPEEVVHAPVSKAPKSQPAEDSSEPSDAAAEELDRPESGEVSEQSLGWWRGVAYLLNVLAIGAVAFLAARLLAGLRRAWRRRPARRRSVSFEVVEFEVLPGGTAVSAAIAEDAEVQRSLLAEQGAPRNAIVDAWHRFEEQAATAGLIRKPWQTTAEFVLEILDRAEADQGAVARLAELYREARFSDHLMSEEHRTAALAELDTIHRSVGRLRVAGQ